MFHDEAFDCETPQAATTQYAILYHISTYILLMTSSNAAIFWNLSFALRNLRSPSRRKLQGTLRKDNQCITRSLLSQTLEVCPRKLIRLDEHITKFVGNANF